MKPSRYSESIKRRDDVSVAVFTELSSELVLDAICAYNGQLIECLLAVVEDGAACDGLEPFECGDRAAELDEDDDVDDKAWKDDERRGPRDRYGADGHGAYHGGHGEKEEDEAREDHI